MSSYAVNPSVS